MTWIPKERLAEELSCSVRNIDSLIAAGVLQPGTCWYATGAVRGKQIFELDRCRDALLQHTAARCKAAAAIPADSEEVTYAVDPQEATQ